MAKIIECYNTQWPEVLILVVLSLDETTSAIYCGMKTDNKTFTSFFRFSIWKVWIGQMGSLWMYALCCFIFDVGLIVGWEAPRVWHKIDGYFNILIKETNK